MVEKSMSPNQRLLLLGLYLCILVFSILMCYQVYQEKRYFQQEILNDQSVKIVSGNIQQFKYFTVVEGDTHIKIKRSGNNKWLMLGKVSEIEKKQLHQGQTITDD